MKKIFLWGCFLFAFSYLEWFIPPSWINYVSLTAFCFCFVIGLILLCDAFTQKVANYSLLKEIIAKPRNLLAYFLTALVGGIVLEFIAQWLGKLWFYPYLSSHLYFLIFSVAFALYWLMITETYLATKVLLDNFIKPVYTPKKAFAFEPPLYKLLGASGAVLFGAGVYLSLQSTYAQNYIFNVQHPLPYNVNFYYILLIFFGLWFFLEYLEHVRQRNSFIQDLLHHYYTPLFAIAISGLLTGLVMETQNVVLGYWVYTNWPFQEIQIFHLPVSMLLAWPLHYIFFLSLFRFALKRESTHIWSAKK